MLFVLEGPDLSGKTTFADELEKYLRYVGTVDSIHRWSRGPLRGSPWSEYLSPLADIHRYRYSPVSASSSKCFILDRWHVGELVYGPLLRGTSQLDLAQARYLDLVLDTLGAVKLYFSTPWKAVARRYWTRGDELISLDQLSAVHAGYARLLEAASPSSPSSPSLLSTSTSASSSWLRVDGTRIPRSENLRCCVKLAELGDDRTTNCSDFTRSLKLGYLGPRWPSRLLLGDRRHGYPEKVDPQRPWPFTPVRGTSGHYLARALELAKNNLRYPESRSYGLVNARELPPEDLTALWWAAGEPPVVALGRHAQHAAREAGVPHLEAQHPQYRRRFHHGKLAEYASMLAGTGTGLDAATKVTS